MILTVEGLDKDIGLSRAMYRETKRTKWAERVNRLERFKSMMLAKQLLEKLNEPPP